MGVMEIREIMIRHLIEIADNDLDKETVLQHCNDITNIGLSSIAYIRYFAKLENEFNVDIEIDEIDQETLYSLDKLALYIINKND